jgi:hypothetical protein
LVVAQVVVVESADREVLVGSHKEGKVREESLVQGEDTNLVERHKAYQEIQVQEDHLDPNYQAEEDKMEDTQGVVRMEGREEEVHAAVAAGVVGVVVLEGLEEQRGELRVLGFDVEEPVLVLRGEDEIRSAWNFDQQVVQNTATMTKMYTA